MENRHIAFSPPDITEEEIAEVVDALKSGWITTGPKTKRFEKELAEYMGTSKVACLNSATAAAELILRVLGVGEGDEVITTAYTYTATASVICSCRCENCHGRRRQRFLPDEYGSGRGSSYGKDKSNHYGRFGWTNL